MNRDVHIIDTIQMSYKDIKLKIGTKPKIQKVKPEDGRFAIGNLFLFSTGVYKLEEIAAPMRCNRKKRYMYFRPIRMESLKKGTLYTVYKLGGLGV